MKKRRRKELERQAEEAIGGRTLTKSGKRRLRRAMHKLRGLPVDEVARRLLHQDAARIWAAMTPEQKKAMMAKIQPQPPEATP